MKSKTVKPIATWQFVSGQSDNEASGGKGQVPNHIEVKLKQRSLVNSMAWEPQFGCDLKTYEINGLVLRIVFVST